MRRIDEIKQLSKSVSKDGENSIQKYHNHRELNINNLLPEENQNTKITLKRDKFELN